MKHTIVIEDTVGDETRISTVDGSSFEWMAQEIAEMAGVSFGEIMTQVNNSRVTFSDRFFATVCI